MNKKEIMERSEIYYKIKIGSVEKEYFIKHKLTLWYALKLRISGIIDLINEVKK